MNHYTFASCRGRNFEIAGNTPKEAWEKLVEREKDNGTLWRASDPYMVKELTNKDWKFLRASGGFGGVAYKEQKATYYILQVRRLNEQPIFHSKMDSRFFNENNVHRVMKEWAIDTGKVHKFLNSETIEAGDCTMTFYLEE